MRIAIIGDIHGNIHALESVEKDIKSQQVDEIVCLGDIVNFGAFPKECLDWVRENCSVVLRGENDTFTAMCDDIILTNPEAIKSADWTYDQLSEKDLEYISNLPLDLDYKNMVLTHDEPSVPGSMHFITSLKDAKETMSCYEEDICFYGHIHIPLIFAKNEESIKLIQNPDIYSLKENEKYLVNCGSVGQPRDRDKRASYVIYDTEKNMLEFRKVNYDIEKASKEIINKGLPYIFAKLLLP